MSDEVHTHNGCRLTTHAAPPALLPARAQAVQGARRGVLRVLRARQRVRGGQGAYHHTTTHHRTRTTHASVASCVGESPGIPPRAGRASKAPSSRLGAVSNVTTTNHHPPSALTTPPHPHTHHTRRTLAWAAPPSRRARTYYPRTPRAPRSTSRAGSARLCWRRRCIASRRRRGPPLLLPRPPPPPPAEAIGTANAYLPGCGTLRATRCAAAARSVRPSVCLPSYLATR